MKKQRDTIVRWVKFRDLRASDGSTILVRQGDKLRLGKVSVSGFGNAVYVDGQYWEYDLNADVALLRLGKPNA
jgi:hypothetical protein